MFLASSERFSTVETSQTVELAYSNVSLCLLLQNANCNAI